VSGLAVVTLVGAIGAVGIVAYGADLRFGDPGRAGEGTPKAASAQQALRAQRAPAPTPTPTATPTAAAPVLKPAMVVVPGHSGRKVRELQSRLDQIEWYSPDISGDYDKVTRPGTGCSR
jgi:hypothetical protein